MVLALASARPAEPQAADPRAAFVESVARFGATPDRASLEVMTRALEQWDASLRSSEQIFAANLPGSPAAAAARMHVAIGAAFLDRGRVADALREFTVGGSLDPGRADVFTFQAVAYDQLLHDYARAAAAYRQAAALDPLSPARAYQLARALDKTGNRYEALAAYQSVLRLWRRDAGERVPIGIDTPFIQLGLVQERPGAEPFFPPAQYAEGFARLQRGDYRGAVDLFTTALGASPPSGDEPSPGQTRYRLGREYQRQNRTLEALAEYEAALRLNPLVGANRLLQMIGALQAAQQNFDAALQAYSTRVDIMLNDADAHRLLGYLYARLDRRDEALAEFAVALTIVPATPDVHVAMSQLHLKNGDEKSELGAAAEAARRAIAMNPSNKQAHYSLATALMRLDRPDEAKPEFEAFERLQKEDTAASARQMTINGLRREAAGYLASGEYDRAVAALQKALELVPDNADVREELADAEALRRR
jgi:tetratricopeptide (TPR) repeat protein